jgi:hypothetical protein
VKPHPGWLGLVEVECLDCLSDVASQFVPSVALSKNAFRQAFSAKAPVWVLGHLEHNFIHTFNLGYLPVLGNDDGQHHNAVVLQLSDAARTSLHREFAALRAWTQH